MPASGRRNHKRARDKHAPRPPAGKRIWLAPPIGAVIIVVLAAAASLAQATDAVFIAAALVFSLAEGVVLALVGYFWTSRGPFAAMLAAAGTAAAAAPARWEVSLLRQQQPVQQTDLLADLVVSIAWGALAGLAGATILRARLASLMHDDRQRFPRSTTRPRVTETVTIRNTRSN